MPVPRQPLIARFFQQASIEAEDDCWEWMGTRGGSSGGYGKIGAGGKGAPMLYAHRVAYELLVGPIPDGHEVDHLCRNPGCVNPEHLEAVLHRENIRRGNGWGGRKARQTHCKRGHPFDEDNTYWWRGGRHCRKCRAAADERRKR